MLELYDVILHNYQMDIYIYVNDIKFQNINNTNTT